MTYQKPSYCHVALLHNLMWMEGKVDEVVETEEVADSAEVEMMEVILVVVADVMEVVKEREVMLEEIDLGKSNQYVH